MFFRYARLFVLLLRAGTFFACICTVFTATFLNSGITAGSWLKFDSAGVQSLFDFLQGIIVFCHIVLFIMVLNTEILKQKCQHHALP